MMMQTGIARFFPLFSVILILGCDSGVIEKDVEAGDPGVRVRVGSHPPSPSGHHPHATAFRWNGAQFFLLKPMVPSQFEVIYFTFQPSDPSKGPIQQANLNMGRTKVHAHQEGEVPRLRLRWDELLSGLGEEEAEMSFEILQGDEWKSFPVRLELFAPLPLLQMRSLNQVFASQGGSLLGSDLIHGSVHLRDFEVENTSPYPVQLRIRLMSTGDFRLTTRWDELLWPDEGARPSYSQLLAEVATIRLEWGGVNPDRHQDQPVGSEWISAWIRPRETLRAGYVLRVLEGRTFKLSYGGLVHSIPVGLGLPHKRSAYGPGSFYCQYRGLDLAGTVPRDVALMALGTHPDEQQNLRVESGRIRFLTRSPERAAPGAREVATFRATHGAVLTHEEWLNAKPRVPEGPVALEP